MNSANSISREWNSSRNREHDCLKALINSEVRSWRLGSSEGVIEPDVSENDDVAMTRNVARSKRMTSVALHASANIRRCLLRFRALGISVFTILDQACAMHQTRHTASKKETDLVQCLVIYTRPEYLDRDIAACFFQFCDFALKDNGPFTLANKIHFVDEEEHARVFAKLRQTVETVAIILEVFGHFAAFHVEHVDHDPGVREDG